MIPEILPNCTTTLFFFFSYVLCSIFSYVLIEKRKKKVFTKFMLILKSQWQTLKTVKTVQ